MLPSFANVHQVQNVIETNNKKLISSIVVKGV